VKTSDLDFVYPEELVATEPSQDFRALLSRQGALSELTSKEEFLGLFQKGDVLVINDTQVEKRRVFLKSGLEVLFVRPHRGQNNVWEVLFPARSVKLGGSLELPGGVTATLQRKGLPQLVHLSQELTSEYFDTYGELALPPYIQKARGERHNREFDQKWYQTAWARNPGSQAAPTASLHFTSQDLEHLEAKGVFVEKLTLHVGLGTFLPVKTERLEEHPMHKEEVHIPAETLERVFQAQKQGQRIWALGTTVTRALETWSQGGLIQEAGRGVSGEADLFIRPGYSFQVVSGLLTNFHQPQSTLLALVAAFAGTEDVLKAYQWAIKRRFQLFSYGDLTVWMN